MPILFHSLFLFSKLLSFRNCLLPSIFHWFLRSKIQEIVIYLSELWSMWSYCRENPLSISKRVNYLILSIMFS
ncbi:hypothetical protein Leryth_004284 [Lithospermum erythrorhizon]|nr:hypothetical protein Leryth_004284 [Lithospermum erythrorhizon]